MDFMLQIYLDKINQNKIESSYMKINNEGTVN
jgi:hypothetical protein